MADTKTIEDALKDVAVGEPRSPPSRNVSMRLNHMPSPNSAHRHSFSDQLRGIPPSPRANRQPSMSHIGVQELYNNPHTAGSADPAFAGRDWRTITVHDLVHPDDLRFVEVDTGIEAATNVRYVHSALNPHKADLR